MKQIKKKLMKICIIKLTFIARLMLIGMPFKRIIGFITNDVTCRKKHRISKEQIKRYKGLSRYMSTLDSKLPWRVMCFEQAVVFGIICRLRRIDYSIRFGIRKDVQGHIQAHAWTILNDQVMTGDEEVDTYHMLYEKSFCN